MKTETTTTILRAVKELGFGSVSESGSVSVLLSLCLSSDQIAGLVSKVFEHPFNLTEGRLQAQVLDSQASSTLPSYMSPVANPMMVSKCSGSRVQVGAVTRCVGRECGVDVCLCWG